jgi:hypothetical protein
VRRFPMSWSTGLRVTSGLFVAVLVAALVLPVLLGPRTGPVAWLLLAALAVTLPTWALAPRGLAVGGAQLLVERRAWRPVRIPLSSIEEVGELPPGLARGSLRIGASGGAFGYYGRFRNAALGTYRMYATRTERLVLLRGGGATWLVSPDRPEAFVEAVLAVAPRARRWSPEGAGADGAGALAETGMAGATTDPATATTTGASTGAAGARRPGGAAGTSRGGRILRVVAMIAPVAALAGLGVTFARAPREVRLQGGEVVVERYLWSPRRIPLSTIRAAAVLPPEALEGARRVRGARVLGALYGTFESPALGRFEIEAPHTGLVLLETAGGDVVVGVVDPERFRARVAAGLRSRRPPR